MRSPAVERGALVVDGPEATVPFGPVLRRRRTAALLTQEQLAERAGLSVRTIRDLERGRVRYPRPGSLRLLAEVLGLTGDELVEFEALGRQRYWAERAARQRATPTGPDLPAAAELGLFVPAQLPADVAGFTGRSDRLIALDGVLDGGLGSIVVLTGAPGVGKTALAVHWAHRVRGAFPDGQLYLNLMGYSGSPPLTPTEALTRLLRGLDVPPDRVPTDVDEASALFRSRVADTRTLLLLDDALRPEQVRPLLPGGPGCLVVVTSRESLRGLVARNGARLVSVPTLDPADSHDLLEGLLGFERAATEADAVGELGTLCGHLPLALRIAAANIAASDAAVAEYTARLRSGNRLAELAVPADTDAMVRGAFDLSYAALPAAAQRLFRVLSVAPGRDVAVETATALLGGAALALLDQLTAANLVEQRSPGRYGQPDLLRLYAAERLAAEDGSGGRTEPWGRLLDHYLARLDAAARTLYPTMTRLPTVHEPAPQPFADPRTAIEWIDAELPSLQAAAVLAAAEGPRSAAWLLGDALRGYFQLRGALLPWRAVATAALAAAEAEADAAAQVTAHLGLGGVDVRHGHYADAFAHGAAALDLAVASGWTAGEVAALRHQGDLHRFVGQADEAIRHLERASTIADPDDPSYPVIVETIAAVNHVRGSLRAAADGYARALSMQAGSPTRSAGLHSDLGDVLGGLGRTDEALEHLAEALRLSRLLGDRGEEAYILRNEAEVHRDAGRLDMALGLASTAADLAKEVADTRVECQATETLATVHLHLGSHALAVTMFETALRLAEASNNDYARAQAMTGMSAAHLCLGDTAAAEAAAEAAAGIARGAGYRQVEGYALTAWARAVLQLGRCAQARELAAAAVAAQESTGWVRGRVEAQRVHDAILVSEDIRT